VTVRERVLPIESDFMARAYTGRFAPSPTGPLHFGSLVAAAASYLDARAHGGRWLVRMEDVDKPRERRGAADSILRTLEQFGFEWDGHVMYQSQRTEAYRAALERLQRSDAVFACACTRRDTHCECRHLQRPPRAWRVAAPPSPVCFNDRLQGRYCETIDDFVVLRADGYFAYQLAVVVDDAEQEVTDVVRGADLLDSTPRQIHLQRLLGVSTPRYLHVPVAVNAKGEKLSKQTLAPAIDAGDRVALLRRALSFLGQRGCDSLHEAIHQWAPDAVPRATAIAAPVVLNEDGACRSAALRDQSL
jgi:glutamyl-Q tRNA(Asp) synthetase